MVKLFSVLVMGRADIFVSYKLRLGNLKWA